MLCHPLASETSNNFNASMACYFDGVNVSFFSHGFSATTHQQATGSECFHLFNIWFVSSCDYLLPQHQYLEKVSAKNCSSLSPNAKESTAKPAFNESLVSCVCFYFELLDPCSGYQFHKNFWIPHVY